MPEVTSKVIYSITLNEKEYAIVLRALAFLTGIVKGRPRQEDLDAATVLNQKLLDIQEAELREKMRYVRKKQERVENAESRSDDGTEV